LFKLEKDLYLQSDGKTDVVLSIAERKSVISSHNYPTLFLIKTISTLCKSCIFVKTSSTNPYQMDSLNFKLENEEMGLVTDFNCQQFWMNNSHKLTRNSLA
jgi:hypothetical protein